MAKYYIICDYAKLITQYKYGANAFQILSSLSDDIMRIWITAYRKQLAPHLKSSNLEFSLQSNYEVDINEPLRMLTINILRKSNLPVYWQVLNYGSAKATTKYGEWLYMRHPTTGEKGKWVPGEWSGSKFMYDPESKTGMWVTKQIKGINWIKYGDDEAIVKVRQLFERLGVI